MPAERPVSKYQRSRQGALLPLEKRRLVTTQERIDRYAIPSWETMEGIFELRMHNDEHLYALSLQHRGILRKFYNARYAIETGQGRDLYNEFRDKYFKKAKLMDELSPHFTLIRDTISPPKPRR